MPHYLGHQSSYLHLTPEITPQFPPCKVHTLWSTAHTLPSCEGLPYSGPPTHSEASSFHLFFRVLLPTLLESKSVLSSFPEGQGPAQGLVTQSIPMLVPEEVLFRTIPLRHTRSLKPNGYLLPHTPVHSVTMSRRSFSDSHETHRFHSGLSHHFCSLPEPLAAPLLLPILPSLSCPQAKGSYTISLLNASQWHPSLVIKMQIFLTTEFKVMSDPPSG